MRSFSRHGGGSRISNCQAAGASAFSDFRLGGLQPGETKQIRGKIYIVPHDVPALLARYGKDFPEQSR